MFVLVFSFVFIFFGRKLVKKFSLVIVFILFIVVINLYNGLQEMVFGSINLIVLSCGFLRLSNILKYLLGMVILLLLIMFFGFMFSKGLVIMYSLFVFLAYFWVSFLSFCYMLLLN